MFQRETLNLDISYSPTEDSELPSMRTFPDKPAFRKLSLLLYSHFPYQVFHKFPETGFCIRYIMIIK